METLSNLLKSINIRTIREIEKAQACKLYLNEWLFVLNSTTNMNKYIYGQIRWCVCWLNVLPHVEQVMKMWNDAKLDDHDDWNQMAENRELHDDW